MQKLTDKYFWDGLNISDQFALRRMSEYAAFPDILRIPFDKLKDGLLQIDLGSLRTDERRIEFIRVIRPHLKAATSLEEAVFKMVGDYFANVK